MNEMSDIDKTNIDALYWANEFCRHTHGTDGALLVTYFANYRFAISDPLDAKLEAMTKACRLYKNCLDDLKELDPSITVAVCGIEPEVFNAMESL